MIEFHGNPPVQKKVLALHDLSCFGRSSLVPVSAIISVMGHQCVPLPTAVFSTHTAIDGWGVRRPDPVAAPYARALPGAGAQI